MADSRSDRPPGPPDVPTREMWGVGGAGPGKPVERPDERRDREFRDHELEAPTVASATAHMREIFENAAAGRLAQPREVAEHVAGWAAQALAQGPEGLVVMSVHVRTLGQKQEPNS